MKKLSAEPFREQLEKMLWITLGCIGLILVLTGALAWSYLQPQGRVSCASFGSYSAALKAYTHGDTWLDANKNGIPCENLYKESQK